MRVSAKADYALRAVIELAGAGDRPVKGERIAQAQEIPLKFLENILGDLRHAGIVSSQRGAEGGYWLARPSDEITVADVVRAVEGARRKPRRVAAAHMKIFNLYGDESDEPAKTVCRVGRT
jgi:Rrf2 family protein